MTTLCNLCFSFSSLWSAGCTCPRKWMLCVSKMQLKTIKHTLPWSGEQHARGGIKQSGEERIMFSLPATWTNKCEVKYLLKKNCQCDLKRTYEFVWQENRKMQNRKWKKWIHATSTLLCFQNKNLSNGYAERCRNGGFLKLWRRHAQPLADGLIVHDVPFADLSGSYHMTPFRHKTTHNSLGFQRTTHHG